MEVLWVGRGPDKDLIGGIDTGYHDDNVHVHVLIMIHNVKFNIKVHIHVVIRTIQCYKIDVQCTS